MRRAGAFLIGILDGEGIGPEVIAAALEVLAAVVEATGLRVEIRRGGVIGRGSRASYGCRAFQRNDGTSASRYSQTAGQS